jgi:hypothetical protein
MQTLAHQLGDTLHHEARLIHLTGLLDDVLVAPVGLLADADPEGYLRHVGRLHAAFGRGTLEVPITGDAVPEPTAIVELLHHVWKQTAICRLGFARPQVSPMQLTAGWGET